MSDNTRTSFTVNPQRVSSRNDSTGDGVSWTYRLIQFLPDTDGLIVRTGHYELAGIADGQCPDLSMMSVKFLNVLELRE